MKRASNAVLAPQSTHHHRDPQGTVPAAKNGAPRTVTPTRVQSLNTLPPELLPPIVRHLDLKGFHGLLGCSQYLKQCAMQIKPLPLELQARINAGALAIRHGVSEQSLRNIGDRFESLSISLSELDDNALRALPQLLGGAQLKSLQLSLQPRVDNALVRLDQLLWQMELCMRTRESEGKGLPPVCQVEIRIDDSLPLEPEHFIGLQDILPQLQQIQITHINICTLKWLQLSAHMPKLQELDVMFWRGCTVRQVACALESRQSPLPRVVVRGWASAGPDGEALLRQLERLGVEHVKLSLFDTQALAEWKPCRFVTLELVENFTDADLESVAELLQGTVHFQALILRDDNEGPRATVDLSLLAAGIAGNIGLQRLEVALQATAEIGQCRLLKGVLAHATINDACLPYPLDLQPYVDRMSASRKDLKLRRNNDYSAFEVVLEQLCQMAQQVAPDKQ